MRVVNAVTLVVDLRSRMKWAKRRGIERLRDALGLLRDPQLQGL